MLPAGDTGRMWALRRRSGGVERGSATAAEPQPPGPSGDDGLEEPVAERIDDEVPRSDVVLDPAAPAGLEAGDAVAWEPPEVVQAIARRLGRLDRLPLDDVVRAEAAAGVRRPAI